jgi:hypothetical protein
VRLDTETIAIAAALARRREAPLGLSRQLAGAMACYRGPLLDGLSLDVSPEYEAWLLGQRQVYHQHMVVIFKRLAALQESAGDLVSAAETLERLVRHEPVDEVAHRRLLELYVALGDRTAGLRVYQAYRAMHAAELAGEPDMKIVALAEQLQSSSMRPVLQGPALSTAIDLPLIGRAGELVVLRERYALACAGEPQVVVLAGEAGMGKSRLAGEYATWITAQGGDMLEGRAFAFGDTLPYGTLVEALRSRLEQENAPDDLLGDRWLVELSQLLPELADRYPDLPLSTPSRIESPGHLYEAVARLIRAWADRHPVVLSLDDMQWTDAATRHLLLYAARRWTRARARVLVLLTVQTDSTTVSEDLSHWLAQVGREAATTCLELGALTETATLQLADVLTGAGSAALPRTQQEVGREAQLGAWLHRASGGKPGLIVALLHRLLEAGLLGFRQLGGGWVLDPDTTWHEPDWHQEAASTAA